MAYCCLSARYRPPDDEGDKKKQLKSNTISSKESIEDLSSKTSECCFQISRFSKEEDTNEDSERSKLATCKTALSLTIRDKNILKSQLSIWLPCVCAGPICRAFSEVKSYVTQSLCSFSIVKRNEALSESKRQRMWDRKNRMKQHYRALALDFPMKPSPQEISHFQENKKNVGQCFCEKNKGNAQMELSLVQDPTSSTCTTGTDLQGSLFENVNSEECVTFTETTNSCDDDTNPRSIPSWFLSYIQLNPKLDIDLLSENQQPRLCRRIELMAISNLDTRGNSDSFHVSVKELVSCRENKAVGAEKSYSSYKRRDPLQSANHRNEIEVNSAVAPPRKSPSDNSLKSGYIERNDIRMNGLHDEPIASFRRRWKSCRTPYKEALDRHVNKCHQRCAEKAKPCPRYLCRLSNGDFILNQLPGKKMAYNNKTETITAMREKRNYCDIPSKVTNKVYEAKEAIKSQMCDSALLNTSNSSSNGINRTNFYARDYFAGNSKTKISYSKQSKSKDLGKEEVRSRKEKPAIKLTKKRINASSPSSPDSRQGIFASYREKYCEKTSCETSDDDSRSGKTIEELSNYKTMKIIANKMNPQLMADRSVDGYVESGDKLSARRVCKERGDTKPSRIKFSAPQEKSFQKTRTSPVRDQSELVTSTNDAEQHHQSFTAELKDYSALNYKSSNFTINLATVKDQIIPTTSSIQQKAKEPGSQKETLSTSVIGEGKDEDGVRESVQFDVVKEIPLDSKKSSFITQTEGDHVLFSNDVKTLDEDQSIMPDISSGGDIVKEISYNRREGDSGTKFDSLKDQVTLKTLHESTKYRDEKTDSSTLPNTPNLNALERDLDQGDGVVINKALKNFEMDNLPSKYNNVIIANPVLVSTPPQEDGINPEVPQDFSSSALQVDTFTAGNLTSNAAGDEEDEPAPVSPQQSGAQVVKSELSEGENAVAGAEKKGSGGEVSKQDEEKEKSDQNKEDICLDTLSECMRKWGRPRCGKNYSFLPNLNPPCCTSPCSYQAPVGEESKPNEEAKEAPKEESKAMKCNYLGFTEVDQSQLEALINKHVDYLRCAQGERSTILKQTGFISSAPDPYSQMCKDLAFKTSAGLFNQTINKDAYSNADTGSKFPDIGINSCPKLPPLGRLSSCCLDPCPPPSYRDLCPKLPKLSCPPPCNEPCFPAPSSTKLPSICKTLPSCPDLCSTLLRSNLDCPELCSPPKSSIDPCAKRFKPYQPPPYCFDPCGPCVNTSSGMDQSCVPRSSCIDPCSSLSRLRSPSQTRSLRNNCIDPCTGCPKPCSPPKSCSSPPMYKDPCLDFQKSRSPLASCFDPCTGLLKSRVSRSCSIDPCTGLAKPCSPPPSCIDPCTGLPKPLSPLPRCIDPYTGLPKSCMDPCSVAPMSCKPCPSFPKQYRIDPITGLPILCSPYSLLNSCLDPCDKISSISCNSASDTKLSMFNSAFSFFKEPQTSRYRSRLPPRVKPCSGSLSFLLGKSGPANRRRSSSLDHFKSFNQRRAESQHLTKRFQSMESRWSGIKQKACEVLDQIAKLQEEARCPVPPPCSSPCANPCPSPVCNPCPSPFINPCSSPICKPCPSPVGGPYQTSACNSSMSPTYCSAKPVYENPQVVCYMRNPVCPENNDCMRSNPSYVSTRICSPSAQIRTGTVCYSCDEQTSMACRSACMQTSEFGRRPSSRCSTSCAQLNESSNKKFQVGLQNKRAEISTNVGPSLMAPPLQRKRGRSEKRCTIMRLGKSDEGGQKRNPTTNTDASCCSTQAEGGKIAEIAKFVKECFDDSIVSAVGNRPVVKIRYNKGVNNQGVNPCHDARLKEQIAKAIKKGKEIQKKNFEKDGKPTSGPRSRTVLRFKAGKNSQGSCEIYNVQLEDEKGSSVAGKSRFMPTDESKHENKCKESPQNVNMPQKVSSSERSQENFSSDDIESKDSQEDFNQSHKEEISVHEKHKSKRKTGGQCPTTEAQQRRHIPREKQSNQKDGKDIRYNTCHQERLECQQNTNENANTEQYSKCIGDTDVAVGQIPGVLSGPRAYSFDLSKYEDGRQLEDARRESFLIDRFMEVNEASAFKLQPSSRKHEKFGDQGFFSKSEFCRNKINDASTKHVTKDMPDVLSKKCREIRKRCLYLDDPSWEAFEYIGAHVFSLPTSYSSKREHFKKICDTPSNPRMETPVENKGQVFRKSRFTHCEKIPKRPCSQKEQSLIKISKIPEDRTVTDKCRGGESKNLSNTESEFEYSSLHSLSARSKESVARTISHRVSFGSYNHRVSGNDIQHQERNQGTEMCTQDVAERRLEDISEETQCSSLRSALHSGRALVEMRNCSPPQNDLVDQKHGTTGNGCEFVTESYMNTGGSDSSTHGIEDLPLDTESLSSKTRTVMDLEAVEPQCSLTTGTGSTVSSHNNVLYAGNYVEVCSSAPLQDKSLTPKYNRMTCDQNRENVVKKTKRKFGHAEKRSKLNFKITPLDCDILREKKSDSGESADGQLAKKRLDFESGSYKSHHTPHCFESDQNQERHMCKVQKGLRNLSADSRDQKCRAKFISHSKCQTSAIAQPLSSVNLSSQRKVSEKHFDSKPLQQKRNRKSCRHDSSFEMKQQPHIKSSLQTNTMFSSVCSASNGDNITKQPIGFDCFDLSELGNGKVNSEVLTKQISTPLNVGGPTEGEMVENLKPHVLSSSVKASLLDAQTMTGLSISSFYKRDVSLQVISNTKNYSSPSSSESVISKENFLDLHEKRHFKFEADGGGDAWRTLEVGCAEVIQASENRVVLQGAYIQQPSKSVCMPSSYQSFKTDNVRVIPFRLVFLKTSGADLKELNLKGTYSRPPLESPMNSVEVWGFEL
ncbi:hypothetical protein ElyMa_000365000 [Elysia marginata]|uniref:ShKT domain-containing protein n=1 Tax=Elysia marginata TaxID=1093978 RepID=A0AAV4FG92_9GAST|nr:hypothetical protein ElyMa_000365000 [Elysia marginata]